MKLKIGTTTFQNMVAKAVKGAGNDNDLYITQLMAIELKDNTLTLTTTDGNNYLYIEEEKVAGDDFYVVVPVDKFSKLIAKLTCDETTLELADSKKGELDKLVVHGNGKYVIELPYDEEGELVEFPDPVEEIEEGDSWKQGEVNLSTIKLLLATAKPALMVGKSDMCYAGYYMGDRVIATDTYKICGVDIKIFDEPKLISPEFLDLLDTISEEKIEIDYNEDTVIFTTDKVTVYGKTMEGVEEYKVDAISGLLDEKFPSSCKVDKSELIRLLDRLSLFVEVFDKNSVYLTFTKEGLLVSSKKDSGAELIPYKESKNFKDYTCCLDIDLFKTQVKAYQSDVIEILYGKDSLKFTQGIVKQIVALANDDRVEAEEENEDE